MRRKKADGQKSVRQILSEIMERKISDEKMISELEGCGVGEADRNMKTALIFDLYNLARKGNSKAVDTVLGLLGESDGGSGETTITVRLVDGEPTAEKEAK